MGKRVTGAIFCLCSVILFAVRYIVRMMFFIARKNAWEGMFFSEAVREVGQPLTMVCIICFAIGIFYLVRAEIDDRRSKKGD